jgi:hypothetical protein
MDQQRVKIRGRWPLYVFFLIWNTDINHTVKGAAENLEIM